MPPWFTSGLRSRWANPREWRYCKHIYERPLSYGAKVLTAIARKTSMHIGFIWASSISSHEHLGWEASVAYLDNDAGGLVASGYHRGPVPSLDLRNSSDVRNKRWKGREANGCLVSFQRPHLLRRYSAVIIYMPSEFAAWFWMSAYMSNLHHNIDLSIDHIEVGERAPERFNRKNFPRWSLCRWSHLTKSAWSEARNHAIRCLYILAI